MPGDGEAASGTGMGLGDQTRRILGVGGEKRGASRIYYYIFDLLCCEGRDLTRLPMIERRALLKSLVMVRDKRIGISDYIEAGADELLAAVRRLACSFRLHLKQ
jgi:ATP-dependent DNA ligase